MEGARIYAQNAIREKNQALNCLRLSSRIDAVANRVQTAIQMKQITKSMAGITKQLDKAMASMNLEQITAVMDKFEKQFEDLDVQQSYVENTMNQTTTLSTPQDQVDALIAAVADEHNLDVSGALGSAVPSRTTAATAQAGAASAAAATDTEQDELSERLAALKAP